MIELKELWPLLLRMAPVLRILWVTLQEMDVSEVERNAQLGIQHAERLAAHGYRQVHPSETNRNFTVGTTL